EISERKMSLYDPNIDFMHEPSDEKDWQESVDIAFYDDETGLCGFLRIGSEPNIGTSQVHFILGTRDGLRYRRNLCDLPMEPHHRTPEGFVAGTMTWTIPNGEYVRAMARGPWRNGHVVFPRALRLYGPRRRRTSIEKLARRHCLPVGNHSRL
ncbi:hypothetical protein DBT53_002565, partial [Aerococcus mictus]|uniref:DUF7065 domain-containing protein n=1 Tax=Aerococcus mictus TaxID=2976810 RepID=UPI002FD5600E